MVRQLAEVAPISAGPHGLVTPSQLPVFMRQLGNRQAAARIFALPARGGLAGGLRRACDLARVPTMERRVPLLVDWLVGIPFEPDIAQFGAAPNSTRISP
jgi:hypothetical protein